MKLLIVGAGAIGGCTGAHLARGGHEVTFVDRDEAHVHAMQRVGLEIRGPVTAFRTPVTACTPEQLDGSFPVILLCVDSRDTQAASEMLPAVLAPDGFVVSMQNGLNEPLIAGAVGEGRTMGAFVNFRADHLEPGVIHYGGRGAVVVGEIDGDISLRAQALRAALLALDEEARITGNILGYLWSELACSAMLFVTALTNDSNAAALARPEHRAVYVAIAREVLALAGAQDIRPEAFDGFDPAAFLPGADDGLADTSLADMVAFNRRSARTRSGIWHDLGVRKPPTEVSMYDQVLAAGAAHNHPMPLTRRMKAMIHEIENGQRPPARANVDAMLAVAG